jgi:hypothetical protein
VGTSGSFPVDKADHSLPSRAEVKNAWNYTSTPQYAFMVWCSVKAQEQYTLTFTFKYFSSDRIKLHYQEEMRFAYRILVGKRERKGPLDRRIVLK